MEIRTSTRHEYNRPQGIIKSQMVFGQLPNRIYSSEQIKIPPTLPDLLKDYSKAVIRCQDPDILAFSMDYFSKRVERKAAGLPLDDLSKPSTWRAALIKPQSQAPGSATTDQSDGRGASQGLKQPPGATTLRFVMVNDVYDLDMLAYYATALRQEKQNAGSKTLTVVGVLAGDFLAPSLLSALDKGRGMIEVLNAAGLDYVCWGNHESDVPFYSMLDRIRESKFTWLNSNMPDLALGAEESKHVKPHTFIPLGHNRRAALLGLVTEDPSVYSCHRFNGCKILPVNATAKGLHKELESKCDVVIPMTHQLVQLDRDLTKTGLFPLVLGGHDHEPFIEKIGDAWMMKVGADAKSIGFADVMLLDEGGWMSKAWMVDAKEYDADPEILKLITLHKLVLSELDKAMLCRVPSSFPLSSQGSRRQQVSLGTMVTAALRSALQVDIALVNGGNIRGNMAYPLDKRTFSYGDLKTEVPFECEMAVTRLPGSVIADTVLHSRQKAIKSTPLENAAFLQIDDRATWDTTTNTLTHINGKPLDRDRMYTVAIPCALTMGVDNITPLLNCKVAHPDAFPCSTDCCVPLKNILVSYFARGVWWELVSTLGFEGLDSDDDGHITRQELEEACKKHYGEDMSRLVVANLIAEVDVDLNGKISTSELLSACLATQDIWTAGDRDNDGLMTIDELRQMAAQHFTSSGLRERDLQLIFDEMDTDGSGTVSFAEFQAKLVKNRHKHGRAVAI